MVIIYNNFFYYKPKNVINNVDQENPTEGVLFCILT